MLGSLLGVGRPSDQASSDKIRRAIHFDRTMVLDWTVFEDLTRCYSLSPNKKSTRYEKCANFLLANSLLGVEGLFDQVSFDKVKRAIHSDSTMELDKTVLGCPARCYSLSPSRKSARYEKRTNPLLASSLLGARGLSDQVSSNKIRCTIHFDCTMKLDQTVVLKIQDTASRRGQAGNLQFCTIWKST